METADEQKEVVSEQVTEPVQEVTEQQEVILDGDEVKEAEVEENEVATG